MYLLPFGLAFGLSFILSAAVKVLAPRAGLVDQPRPDRWHRRPTPRLGGVAIYVAFTAAALLASPKPLSQGTLALLVGGAAIFLVGLVDDLVRLENRPKLLLLILCSVIPVLMGVRFELAPVLIGTPLAVLWILGTTNAVNWLDNMDGVAGGVAAIASLNLFLFAVLADGGEGARLALILAGAALGFLIFNFPPAKLFMGDSGSGFLGFTLATIAVIGSYPDVSNVLLTVLVPGFILSVPIFDTALVTVLRVLDRRSIFGGGRDHPAHRLVVMGLSARRAVLLLYGLSALAGSLPLAASALGFLPTVSVSGILALGFVALGIVLAEVRVFEGEAVLNGVTQLPRPFQNKKWIMTMLLDIVLVGMAYVSAHVLRFEGQLPSPIAAKVAWTLPLVLVAKMAGFYFSGVYRGAWRFAGMSDLVRLVQGTTAGSLLATAGLYLSTRFIDLSRTALVMDWLLTLLLLAGSRLSLRLLREYLAAHTENGRRALIFGAGRGGTLLLDELRQNTSLECYPIGFVDDDPYKQAVIIRGLPVLGTRHDLRELIIRYQVEQVLLAAPSCSRDVLAQVISVCQSSGVEARRLSVSLQSTPAADGSVTSASQQLDESASLQATRAQLQGERR
jgi:UDP-GlcNAc:undecaprenyl-phosphate GlcNAc-1-phosphate transferase